MRRSFDGDALYRAVFTEYVTRLVVGGYPIEFFIEGMRFCFLLHFTRVDTCCIPALAHAHTRANGLIATPYENHTYILKLTH